MPNYRQACKSKCRSCCSCWWYHVSIDLTGFDECMMSAGRRTICSCTRRWRVCVMTRRRVWLATETPASPTATITPSARSLRNLPRQKWSQRRVLPTVRRLSHLDTWLCFRHCRRAHRSHHHPRHRLPMWRWNLSVERRTSLICSRCSVLVHWLQILHAGSKLSDSQ